MQPTTSWAFLHLDTWVWLLSTGRWASLGVSLAGALVGVTALRTRRSLGLVLGAVLLLLGLGTFVYARSNFVEARQLQLCRDTVHNLGGGVEAWASTHDGQLPRHLEDLEPAYLAHLPLCPSAHADTYSSSYQANPKTGVFTLYCSGAHHRLQGAPPPNLPRYGNECGLSPARVP